MTPFHPNSNFFDRFRAPVDREDLGCDDDLDRQADIEAERADQKHEQDATRDGED